MAEAAVIERHIVGVMVTRTDAEIVAPRSQSVVLRSWLLVMPLGTAPVQILWSTFWCCSSHQKAHDRVHGWEELGLGATRW